MLQAMNGKQRAAEAAVTLIQSGQIVGLGTGSTADYFLAALGNALKSGQLKDIRGIPTSIQSERRAKELGIPLLDFSQRPFADLTVDGADEVSPQLDLIKGLGGALLREKIVAQNSHKLVIIADGSKDVAALGTKSPLPVEVAQFAHQLQEPFLRSLGCEPTLRHKSDGSIYVTDNGNYIYDCKFPRIDRPDELEKSLKKRAGIVESGLFVGIARTVLIGDDNGVQRRDR
jgi:ribose 5-phosphate isomerase A